MEEKVFEGEEENEEANERSNKERGRLVFFSGLTYLSLCKPYWEGTKIMTGFHFFLQNYRTVIEFLTLKEI